MKTPAEIEAQIRADNPRARRPDGTYGVAGDADYEERIAEWTAIEIAAEAIRASRKVWADAGAFLAEFDLTETAAIELSADATIAALRLILAAWSGEVWSDDPRIQLGLSALVSAGIISSARRDVILAL